MKKRAAQLAVSATENAYKPSVKIEETTSPASRTSCYNRVLRLITAIVIRKVRTCNAELLGAAGAAMGAKRRSGQSFISWMGTLWDGPAAPLPPPIKRAVVSCLTVVRPGGVPQSPTHCHVSTVGQICTSIASPSSPSLSSGPWRRRLRDFPGTEPFRFKRPPQYTVASGVTSSHQG